MKLILSILAVSLFTGLSCFAGYNSSMEHTSQGGLKGFTEATEKNYKGGWINSRLVVIGSDGTKTKFAAALPYISAWGFVDHDTAVVIRSIGVQGPYYYQKFNIASGHETAFYYVGKVVPHVPYWVKPFFKYGW